MTGGKNKDTTSLALFQAGITNFCLYQGLWEKAAPLGWSISGAACKEGRE